jgi:kynurenine formamidase
VVSAELIAAALADQATESRPGDILLVRTGYMGAYLDADLETRTAMRTTVTTPGLSAEEDMAEYLWDGRFAAVAVDNPGVEVLPRDLSRPFLHTRLLPMLGFPLGEFFVFEELAAACRRDGRYSCFLCSVPLHLPRGVGSPANAVALR